MMLNANSNPTPRTRAEIQRWFAMPFSELLYQAQTVHRQFFPKPEMQISTLLSIKTGACPEDCQYCPQSGHYQTGLKSQKLLPLATVIAQATAAKAEGATRFCMGAAWRSPPKQALPQVQAMIRAVKALGLETCMTLGMLEAEDAAALKTAGLDYYNHNLDSSPEFYQTIISTRTYQDRLDTLSAVRQAGLKVCCGGIVGMGETEDDRIGLLEQLANLPEPPESVPINQLIPIPGTPLADAKPLSGIDLVKTIAVARIVLPSARIRLSAGREQMSDELQTLCFVAGANSIFYGEQLLTAANPSRARDQQLLAALGIERAL